jgi:RNA polymerase sigma-70 factor (ECF subfamily)
MTITPLQHRRLVHYVARFVPRQDAEDLVQDAYVKMLTTTHGFEGRNGCAEESWLFTVCRNTAISALRKARLEVAEAQDAPIPATQEDLIYVREVLEAADALVPKFSAALDAVVVHGHTDAPASLGILEGTFKSRLHRARHALREEMA